MPAQGGGGGGKPAKPETEQDWTAWLPQYIPGGGTPPEPDPEPEPEASQPTYVPGGGRPGNPEPTPVQQPLGWWPDWLPANNSGGGDTQTSVSEPTPTPTSTSTPATTTSHQQERVQDEEKKDRQHTTSDELAVSSVLQDIEWSQDIEGTDGSMSMWDRIWENFQNVFSEDISAEDLRTLNYFFDVFKLPDTVRNSGGSLDVSAEKEARMVYLLGLPTNRSDIADIVGAFVAQGATFADFLDVSVGSNEERDLKVVKYFDSVIRPILDSVDDPGRLEDDTMRSYIASQKVNVLSLMGYWYPVPLASDEANIIDETPMLPSSPSEDPTQVQTATQEPIQAPPAPTNPKAGATPPASANPKAGTSPTSMLTPIAADTPQIWATPEARGSFDPDRIVNEINATVDAASTGGFLDYARGALDTVSEFFGHVGLGLKFVAESLLGFGDWIRSDVLIRAGNFLTPIAKRIGKVGLAVDVIALGAHFKAGDHRKVVRGASSIGTAMAGAYIGTAVAVAIFAPLAPLGALVGSFVGGSIVDPVFDFFEGLLPTAVASW